VKGLDDLWEGLSGRSRAERTVRQRLRTALGPEWRLYPNVRWLAPTRPHGPARDGETDVVLVEPVHGVLAVEVKGGIVRRDRSGAWYSGDHRLDPPPFGQAETSKRVLEARIAQALAGQPGSPPRVFHAVAFPDVDRASVAHRASRGLAPAAPLHDLGPDAPSQIVLDRSDLANPEATRRAVERIFAFWIGDGARHRPLSEAAVEIIDQLLAPEVVLRPLLRGDIDAGEADLLEPTERQLEILRILHHVQRAAVHGRAGSGKTILAVAKTRQLADQGLAVLLVCFNQPLARELARSVARSGTGSAPGRVTVSTFHELCRSLGTRAGVLPPMPATSGPDWWNTVLPGALDRAIPALDERFDAVVVDEGQDFETNWMLTLDLLLAHPGEDAFYVFFDPCQSIIRRRDPFDGECQRALGLQEYDLPANCRNSRPIHDLAYRFYGGDLGVKPLRSEGRAPEIIAAEPGEPTLSALRDVLHRLTVDEGVDRSEIAVLCGTSLEHSAAWHRQHHRFGGVTLWNGNVDDAGHPLGLPADRVPPQPPRTVLCDSIHRFKGLDRPVVILVELNSADPNLDRLLYVGLSRALHHLVVIAPLPLAERLAVSS
jgi:hypothetical protein